MNYKQLTGHRTVLLDLYKSLHTALGKEGKSVDAGLRAAQKNIEAEKFLLAIVGEVKAGKSTFINALLGEAILPYEALQAISEIIEIDKSDKKEVRVTFANGTEQVVEDDLQTPENETVPFLKKIAAVKDEYRDIPVVQVNKFLMDRYSDKNKRAVFSEEELKAFIDSDLKNIHKLETGEFARKIRQYVQNNISCAGIPKTVALGYPIEFLQSKHFKIVDTPGINAIGGIEDQTKNFINQADAVIYLHKVGQQESIALRYALENVIPKRVKGRLILVLTHRSQIDEDERERILDATKSYYPEIGADNIFLVDSLTELYLREFYTKTMDEVRAIRKENSQIRRLTADCFEMAEGDINEFLSRLEAQANFDEIRKRIERDAQNSASNQMKNFATHLKEEYEVLDNNISARIEPLRKKYQDPQSFASEIQKHKDETERMRSDYNEFTAELREDFNPQVRNNRYYKKIDQIVKEYIAKVNDKEFEMARNTDMQDLTRKERKVLKLDKQDWDRIQWNLSEIKWRQENYRNGKGSKKKMAKWVKYHEAMIRVEVDRFISRNEHRPINVENAAHDAFKAWIVGDAARKQWVAEEGFSPELAEAIDRATTHIAEREAMTLKTLNTVASYVEKLAEDFGDEMTQFVHSLEADFKKKIEERAIDVQSDYSITVPKISVRNIKKESEKGDISKSDPQKAWENIKPKLIARFTNSMTHLQKEINALINDFCDRYERPFNGELQGRQRYMESLEMDKRTNEELRDEILDLEASKKLLKESIKKCTQIAGEL